MSNCVIKTIFIALLTVLAGLSVPRIAQGDNTHTATRNYFFTEPFGLDRDTL